MTVPSHEQQRAELVRKRIRGTAQRREQQLTTMEAIAEEIRRDAAAAKEVGIPMAEVARLLGIDRSTLYRTYLDAA